VLCKEWFKEGTDSTIMTPLAIKKNKVWGDFILKVILSLRNSNNPQP
jgi:hypothetical protein